jgi:hypothetical protein
MYEIVTRPSFSESPACPELARGRPFEARPGPTATPPFCKTRSRPAPMRSGLTVIPESFAQGYVLHFKPSATLCLVPVSATQARNARRTYIRLKSVGRCALQRPATITLPGWKAHRPTTSLRLSQTSECGFSVPAVFGQLIDASVELVYFEVDLTLFRGGTKSFTSLSPRLRSSCRLLVAGALCP